MKISGAAEFLKDLAAMRWYLAVSALLFAGGIAFGAASESFGAYMEGQLEPLRRIVAQAESSDNAQLLLFLIIFLNNFVKMILMVFLGAIFGLFPIYFLVSNGMIIGYVVASAGRAGLDVVSLVVRGLLPHGMLETAAIVIAAAYGLRYGMLIASELFLAFRGRGSGDRIKKFHSGLKRLAAFLFFALLAAAFIESTVTYALVRG